MPSTVTILTPPGVAAIAVVRLHGTAVSAFSQAHLSRAPRVGACVHTELRDAERTIDDPVAVLVDEQTLDLSVHGGAWIVSRTLELARRFGFVDANEQPATDIEAEMLRDLPRALTREALAILLAQPAAWESMLRDNDHAAMERALADRSLVHLLNPPMVAIVGAPNVGKSTLANQLFARDHSITADLPGTTRDWVGEQANLDGLVVTLIDTPGVRETDDAIEREAIARSSAVVKQAALMVRVLDATLPPDAQVLTPRPRVVDSSREYTGEGAREVLIMNKVDRGLGWSLPNALQVCATTGQGVDELRRVIRQRFGCDALESTHARAWTTRQRDLLVARASRP